MSDKLNDPYEHRHYVSYHPTCNRLLAKKWDQANRNLHIQKLQKAKHALDNGQPRKFKHLDVKLKRIQLEKDRQAEINRDNKTLVERMTCLMHRHTNLSTLDMEPYKYQLLEMTQSKRIKNIKTIHRENLNILQRLEYKAPYYNHHSWVRDRHRTVGYLKSIATFPYRYMEQFERYDRKKEKKEEEQEKLINPDGTTPKPGRQPHSWRRPPLPGIHENKGQEHSIPAASSAKKENIEKKTHKTMPTTQDADSTHPQTNKETEENSQLKREASPLQKVEDQQPLQDGTLLEEKKPSQEGDENKDIPTQPKEANAVEALTQSIGSLDFGGFEDPSNDETKQEEGDKGVSEAAPEYGFDMEDSIKEPKKASETTEEPQSFNEAAPTPNENKDLSQSQEATPTVARKPSFPLETTNISEPTKREDFSSDNYATPTSHTSEKVDEVADYLEKKEFEQKAPQEDDDFFNGSIANEARF